MAIEEYLEEPFLVGLLWKIQVASGLAVFLIFGVLDLKLVYGIDKGAGFIPAKLGWLVMELPSLLIPVYLVFESGGKNITRGEFTPGIVFAAMFILHYFHRAVVYSLASKGRPIPILIVLFATLFTTCNGYVQVRYHTHYATYETSWFWDPRFIAGHVLFLVGMAINIQSDMILRGLRKPGETGYKIPYGGLFTFVSSPNYFGESLEWTGFALACWSMPATGFAVFTTLFLGGQAMQHHRFYLKKFEDYPKERKAFIPYIL